MGARFENIRVGEYELIDVGGDHELARRADDFREHWKAAMIYQRGRGETLKLCRADSKPEPENAIIGFAVLKDGEFCGVWDLIGLETRSLSAGLWDVSVQMSPCLSDVRSGEYVNTIVEIGNHLLSFPLSMTGGGNTQIREWTFPDQDTGEDPTHQWGVEEVPGLRKLAEAQGLVFETHFREHPKYGRTEYMKSISKQATPPVFTDGP